MNLDNPSQCNCAFCGRKIADIIGDQFVPSAEECYRNGNVPVPNFGWFCSQQCAVAYEKEHHVKFLRNELGLIDYYTEMKNGI